MDFQKLLEALRTTPSGDNCQPWNFRREGNAIVIEHIEDRARHSFNIANSASYLSLGCALEILSVAAAQQQLATQISITGLCAKITFSPSREQPLAALDKQIPQRATDRRLFQGGSISDPVFADIRADSADFPGSEMGLCDQIPQNVRDFILLCEEIAWSSPAFTRDLLQWIRFSDSEAHKTADGMTWRNLGVNYMDSRSLLLLKNFPEVRRLGFCQIISLLARQVAQKQLHSSAGLLIFAAKSPQLEDLVAVGRLGMRAWLRLNQHGYGVQPLTAMSLFAFDSAARVIPRGHFDEKFVAAFAQAPQILRQAFSLSDKAFPAWAFRVGRSTPLPQNMRTLRRPVG